MSGRTLSPDRNAKGASLKPYLYKPLRLSSARRTSTPGISSHRGRKKKIFPLMKNSFEGFTTARTSVADETTTLPSDSVHHMRGSSHSSPGLADGNSLKSSRVDGVKFRRHRRMVQNKTSSTIETEPSRKSLGKNYSPLQVSNSQHSNSFIYATSHSTFTPATVGFNNISADNLRVSTFEYQGSTNANTATTSHASLVPKTQSSGNFFRASKLLEDPQFGLSTEAQQQHHHNQQISTNNSQNISYQPSVENLTAREQVEGLQMTIKQLKERHEVELAELRCDFGTQIEELQEKLAAALLGVSMKADENDLLLDYVDDMERKIRKLELDRDRTDDTQKIKMGLLETTLRKRVKDFDVLTKENQHYCLLLGEYKEKLDELTMIINKKEMKMHFLETSLHDLMSSDIHQKYIKAKTQLNVLTERLRSYAPNETDSSVTGTEGFGRTKESSNGSDLFFTAGVMDIDDTPVPRSGQTGEEERGKESETGLASSSVMTTDMICQIKRTPIEKNVPGRYSTEPGEDEREHTDAENHPTESHFEPEMSFKSKDQVFSAR